MNNRPRFVEHTEDGQFVLEVIGHDRVRVCISRLNPLRVFGVQYYGNIYLKKDAEGRLRPEIKPGGYMWLYRVGSEKQPSEAAKKKVHTILQEVAFVWADKKHEAEIAFTQVALKEVEGVVEDELREVDQLRQELEAAKYRYGEALKEKKRLTEKLSELEAADG